MIGPLFDSVDKGLSDAYSHLNKFCATVDFDELLIDESPFKKKMVALSSLARKAPYTMNGLILRRVCRKRAHTILNGVDTDYFDPEATLPIVDRIIFVGTLSWYPNIVIRNHLMLMN